MWAASELGGPHSGTGLSSTGRCWLDALELALRCSSLLRLSTGRQSRDSREGDPGSSPDASPSSLCGLLSSTSVPTDQDLFA